MEAWEQLGLPVVEFPQTPARMVPATAGFYDAVVNKQLTHTGDPRLARHAANATPHYSRGGLMVKKESKNSLKRIDLLVAGIMAHSRAATLGTTPGPQPKAEVKWIEL
jgi:phage terminase large subunit-like protein